MKEIFFELDFSLFSPMTVRLEKNISQERDNSDQWTLKNVLEPPKMFISYFFAMIVIMLPKHTLRLPAIIWIEK